MRIYTVYKNFPKKKKGKQIMIYKFRMHMLKNGIKVTPWGISNDTIIVFWCALCISCVLWHTLFCLGTINNILIYTLKKK